MNINSYPTRRLFSNPNVTVIIGILSLLLTMIFSLNFFRDSIIILFFPLLCLIGLFLLSKPNFLIIGLILTSFLPISYKHQSFPELFIFDFLLIIMLLVLIFQTGLKGKISLIPETSVEKTMYLFLFIAGLSLLINWGNIEEYGPTYLKVGSVGFLVLVYITVTYFFVSRTLDSKEKIGRIINLILALGLLNGISGIYNFITIGPARSYRLGSMIGHFGDTLNLMLPVLNLSFSLLIFQKMNMPKKCLLICLSFMSFIVLLMTMTRSIWVMTFLSFFIIIFFGTSKNIFKKVFGVVLICLALIIVLYKTTDSEIFIELLLNPFELEGPTRGELLKRGFEIFKENPIWGTGIGSGLFLGVYKHEFIISISAISMPTASLHNQYLTIAMETGILGLSIIMYLLFALAKDIYVTFKRSKDPFFKAILLSVFTYLISYLVGMSVGGGVIPPHNGLRTMLYFWVLCAIAAAIKRTKIRTQS